MPTSHLPHHHGLQQSALPQTLDSILAQTYPHFELLIWDDGSTDNSVEIA